MDNSLFDLFFGLHIKCNPLFYDADLRAKHLAAIEKACEEVRDMPHSIKRVHQFQKIYKAEMEKS